MVTWGMFGGNNANPEMMALAVWQRRFETLINSGQLNGILPTRSLMYATLPKSFQPLDPAIHELLSGALLGQKAYKEAIEEIDYALSLVNDHPLLLHRKCLALLGLAGKDKAHILTYLSAASIIVDAIMKKYSAAQTNPEFASLEGRIYRDLWYVHHQPEHLTHAKEAYYRAWDADESQYFPGINYAEMYLAWLIHNQMDVTLANAVFTKLIGICQQQRMRGDLTFWNDFTIGQAWLGLNQFEPAKDAYRAGLNCAPAPTAREWEAAMQRVDRMAALVPTIGVAEVEAINKLLEAKKLAP